MSIDPNRRDTPLSATVLMPADPALAGGRLEIVFIDGGLADWSSLAAAASPGMEVVLLDPAGDGVAQMAEHLSGRSGVAAIHLLSHGEPGRLQVGTATVDLPSLDEPAAAWSTVRAALAEDADFLIYGCDVAAGESGAALLARLAEVTGADIAASSNLTGHGADWVLEFEHGAIEAASLAATDYAGVLSFDEGTAATYLIDEGSIVHEALLAAAGLPGDKVAFLWAQYDGYDDENYQSIYNTAPKITIKGTANNTLSEFSLSELMSPATSSAGGSNYYSEVVGLQPLESGNMLVYWYSGSSGKNITDAYYGIVDQSGNVVKGASVLNTGGSLNRSVQTAELSNGNIVFLWDTGTNGGAYSYKIVDPSGDEVVAQTNITNVGTNADAVVHWNGAQVAASDNGGFLVVYHSYGTGNSGHYKGMLFDNDGTLRTVGGQQNFQVFSTGRSGAAFEQVVSLSDGSYAVFGETGSTGSGPRYGTLRKVGADGTLGVETNLVTTTYDPSTGYGPTGSIIGLADGGFVYSQDGLVARRYDNTVSQTAVETFSSNADIPWPGPIYFSGYDRGFGYAWNPSDAVTYEPLSIQASTFEFGGPNTAPVLTDTARSLAAVDENAGAPVGAVGSLVSALVSLGSNVTDADAGAVTGVALTAVDASQGTWYYSVNGGTSWVAVGAVSGTSALLLRSTDRLYFQPNANVTGGIDPAVTFRAWDQTSGTAGTKVDASVNGNATAFSTATDTASVTVTDVDPVLANATVSINENSANGTAVTTVAATGDTNGLIYAITGGNTSGAFAINPSTGAITVANAAALDYETTPSFTLTITVDDEDADTAADSTATLTVNLNNLSEFAPTLSVANGTYVENAAATAVDAAAAANDADGDTEWNGGSLEVRISAGSIAGQAGTDELSVLTTGSFSLSGGVLRHGGTIIGTVTETSGTANDGVVTGTDSLMIDFNVNASNAIVQELVRSIAYRSTSDDPTHISLNGLATTRTVSFTLTDRHAASVTDTSVITLTPVNDAPSFSQGQVLTAIPEDAGTGAGNPGEAPMLDLDLGVFGAAYFQDAEGSMGGMAVAGNTADAATQGVWQYSTDGGTDWHDVGAVSSSAALLLRYDTLLRFVPVANYHGNPPGLSVHAVDGSGATVDTASDWTDGGSRSYFDTTADDATSSVSATPVSIGLTITPEADTPAVTDASAQPNSQTTSGLVISRNAADGGEVTHFRITGISQGTLYLADGVTQVADGTFITAAQGAAGLRFTNNGTGDGSFQVQASLSADDAGLGGTPATANIFVGVGVASATTQEDTLSGAITITRGGPAQTHVQVTDIAGGTLYLDAAGTQPVTDGEFIAFPGSQLQVYFLPAADAIAPGSFSVQGATAGNVGGLVGAVAESAITVEPVADTPSVTDAFTVPGGQSSSGLVITRAAVDGTEVTHFKITGISNGTLYLADGTTPVSEGAFITVAQGGAGLRFTPSGTEDGSFSVQASTSASDAGLGGSPVTATVDMGVAVGSVTIDEDTDSGSIAILGNSAYYRITDITGGTLFADAAFTQPIANGDFIAAAGGSTPVYFRPTPDAHGVGGFSVQGSTTAAMGGLEGNTADATVTVTPVNDAPSTSGLGGDVLAYLAVASTGARVIDQGAAAAVADIDSTDFAGGSLVVSVSANRVAVEDVLSIRHVGTAAGQIGFDGTNVSYGGSVFATAAGGTGSDDLVITFTGAGATPEAVSALLRQITYLNLDTATATESTRTVRFTLDDGDGGPQPAVQVDTSVVVTRNALPVGADASVTVIEDAQVVLSEAHFGFSDADASDVLVQVRIAGIPAAGDLTLSGAPVTVGQVIAAADIAAGRLVFTPQANVSGAGYAQLEFEVHDGKSYSAQAYTLTFDVAQVNDAPSGANGRISVDEDSVHVFAAADFGFADAQDTPAHALAAVRITAVPAAGQLLLGDVPVTAGLEVSAADLAAGRLRFLPAANANGTAYASLGFQVRDNGGTAHGGADLDPVPRTLVIDVAAVNDEPRFDQDTLRMSVPENETTLFDVRAQDADGDVLRYALAGGEDAALFAIDPVTGRLSFVTAPDFEAPADHDADNVYRVIVQAVDGSLTQALQTVQLTVSDVFEVVPGVDDDGDGIDTTEEQQVPNGKGGGTGDGNGDGVNDALQEHVSSLPTQARALDGTPHYVTLATDTHQKIAQITTLPVPADVPSNVRMPLGLFDFTVTGLAPGGMAEFSMYVDASLRVTGYYKKGADGRWQNIAERVSLDPVTGKTRIDFGIRDGGPLDEDGLANGIVVDPGAPGYVDEDAELVPTQEVYRFYHQDIAKHFYTAEEAERDGLVADPRGWQYDGPVFSTPVDGSGEAMWRFFNPDTGNHFYTMETDERDHLIDAVPQYVFEGESYRAYRTQEQGTVPLYRFYNVDTANHFYTTSEQEKTQLIGLGDYTYEGVLGYVFA